jgi:hypothetical protein
MFYCIYLFQPGSAGGGVIIIKSTGDVQNDGLIDVSAASAPFQGTGGGSGGSIYINCKLFTGKGILFATQGAHFR